VSRTHNRVKPQRGSRGESMHTYTQFLYQIIFHTKRNEKTLLKQNRKDLFSYIAATINKQNSFVYEIGGTENHIHIITRIHPAVAVSDVVKNVKLSATKMIKTRNLFPGFCGWQEGFSAFSYTQDALENLIEYARNQEIHHLKESSRDEYKRLLMNNKIDFNDEYLF
jgi:REP element-mobilizing transposase RayT